MDGLMIGQLIEIGCAFILIIALGLVYQYGPIRQLMDLRIAFVLYCIVLVTTIGMDGQLPLVVEGLIKYFMLIGTAHFVHQSVHYGEERSVGPLMHILFVVGVLLMGIILFVTDRVQYLESTGYLILGFVFIMSGVYWFRSVLSHIKASKWVGVAFVLFGLHLTDFIYLRYNAETVIVGYLASAALIAFMTFALIVMDFEYLKYKDDLRNERYRGFFENANDAILMLEDSRIIDCNLQASLLFGMTKGMLIGKTPVELSPELQENGKESYVVGGEAAEKVYRGETVVMSWLHRNTKGEILKCRSALFPVGEKRVGVVIRDLTAEHSYEEELNFHKYYDSLTYLPKRDLFIDRLGQVLEDRWQQVALIAFNIDNFKEINDQYGHETGDYILTQVADRVKKAFNKEVTMTRLGGDEFVLILDRLRHRNRVYIPVERISMIFETSFNLDNEELLTVSACLGVAFPDTKDEAPMSLLGKADLALNLAKGKGRGKLEFYSEDGKAEFSKRIQLEREIKEGIAKGEFIPYYQPLVDPLTESIIGAEALARWQREDGKTVYPDVFIGIAEETDQIRAIGQQILENVCQDLQEVMKIRPDFIMHVNLSPMQLRDDAIVEELRSVMERWEITARHLAVEMTETVFIEDQDRTNRVLKKIRDMGIAVALDDFGTGYSSLSYLSSMQVDMIKIDRSFVLKLPSDHRARAMMEYLAQLLKELEYAVVVEGVEEKDQADYLSNIGCECIQGYYYYRPMPFEQLANELKNKI